MAEPLLYSDGVKVFEVPPDQVETANRAGLVPATKEQVAAADKRAAAGTAGR